MRWSGRRVASALVATVCLIVPGFASAQSVEDLRAMSLEDLTNVQISSVSKSVEPLSDAPAAIYVVTGDDVIRSGATTIPEMLRLAPNLEVAQLNASTYAISARGFNVSNNASFSNKLLVMIDGRSIYTPLFGGVYWDMQQVLPENIDRIEVVSGPGATLWGANAVNGIINIITKGSGDNQGGLLTVGGGNLERMASLQYSGRLDGDLTYRVHAEGVDFSEFRTPQGHGAGDGWSKPQGGFRLDWTPPGDAVTLQGELFTAQEDPNGFITGRYLAGNWQHQFGDGSTLQVEAYYDKEARFLDNGAGAFNIETFNLDIQHSFAVGSWNNVVWGAGERVFSYDIENTAIALIPSKRTLNLANVFGQDTMTLADRFKLTVGLKLEDEPYVGVQVMPSVRGSWKVLDSTLLWAAVSRAVRSPTPVDEDFHEYSGPTDVLGGSHAFLPEELTAYELGARVQTSPRLSFSLSGFYNVYDDLRTVEPSLNPPPVYAFANEMRGLIYGLEMWGSYRVTDWWRLTAGFSIQHEHLRIQPGSRDVGGLDFAADDPNHQASLRSSIDFGHGVTWDAYLRYVGALHHPKVADYGELNMRLGWQVTPAVDLSVSGFNLLHDQHREFYEDGVADEIPRSFFVETRWRF